MPVNSLTRSVGLGAGPVLFGTLIKHYFEQARDRETGMTDLRKDELLYDQAFNLVKYFLKASSLHTVEEVQAFSNTRTPAPPWIHVVRVTIPMSCCDKAAVRLIKALGGEAAAKRVVGGTKWWQVRGISGVEAQWITAKKDWREAKRRYKAQAKMREMFPPEPSAPTEETGTYEKDMDEMRCILYLHGGGYYFGSVDQERYSIQRHARKINGRVLAINYRLAPQYPFPCAIQDALAAYIYLIDPPPGAAHRAVKPAHIVVAGDSAGGGVSLGLLQVIRDSGLPLPAGGVLISPWCDLTHSFPSIHTNTSTDVMPEHGLSLHKPSLLWPPPSEEVTQCVHASIHARIRQLLHPTHSDVPTSSTANPTRSKTLPVDVGKTTALPSTEDDTSIRLRTESSEVLEIENQVQFYAPNHLLGHPLVSSVLSYLGGLPPLLVITSDGEVLRDEGIYLAHKAANPEEYPIREEAKKLYPILEGIEERYGPTPVHLQVYDDAAHVLPVLFPFTTPAKFCYRAIATFTKHVTGMPFTRPSLNSPLSSSATSYTTANTANTSETIGSPVVARASRRMSLHRSVSANFERVFRRTSVRSSSVGMGLGLGLLMSEDPGVESPSPKDSREDIAGPRFGTGVGQSAEGPRLAGDPAVYTKTADTPAWTSGMIRERVSTQGVIRPLEPPSSLSGLQVPPHTVGKLSELAIRRYCDAKSKFDVKFSSVLERIEKHRTKNIEAANKDTLRNIAHLASRQRAPDSNSSAPPASPPKRVPPRYGIAEGLMVAAGSWSWAWALDTDERPPPSSIVSRRDTEEARLLARIADEAVVGSVSGNSLWSSMVNFLTASPHPSATVAGLMGDADEPGAARGGRGGSIRRIVSYSAKHKLKKAYSSQTPLPIAADFVPSP